MTIKSSPYIKIEIPEEIEMELIKNPSLSLNISPIIDSISDIQTKIVNHKNKIDK